MVEAAGIEEDAVQLTNAKTNILLNKREQQMIRMDELIHTFDVSVVNNMTYVLTIYRKSV
jgi:hypothetical protein